MKLLNLVPRDFSAHRDLAHDDQVAGQLDNIGAHLTSLLGSHGVAVIKSACRLTRKTVMNLKTEEDTHILFNQNTHLLGQVTTYETSEGNPIQSHLLPCANSIVAFHEEFCCARARLRTLGFEEMPSFVVGSGKLGICVGPAREQLCEGISERDTLQTQTIAYLMPVRLAFNSLCRVTSSLSSMNMHWAVLMLATKCPEDPPAWQAASNRKPAALLT